MQTPSSLEEKKAYESPAHGIDYSSFVLELGVVNGRKGMRQFVQSFRLPSARATISIIGEDTKSEDQEQLTVPLYCPYGTNCTKYSCKFMHCTKMPKDSAYAKPERKSHSVPPPTMEHPDRLKVSSSRRRRLRRKRQKEKWNAIANGQAAAQMMWMSGQWGMAMEPMAPIRAPHHHVHANAQRGSSVGRPPNSHRDQHNPRRTRSSSRSHSPNIKKTSSISNMHGGSSAAHLGSVRRYARGDFGSGYVEMYRTPDMYMSPKYHRNTREVYRGRQLYVVGY